VYDYAYHCSEQEIEGDLSLCHRDMAVEQSALRKTQQRIKDIIEVMLALKLTSLVAASACLLYNTSAGLVSVLSAQCSVLSVNQESYKFHM
jgi:hypothetical protein